MNQKMNRMQLLHWINTISFTVNEMTLYMDTHPEDKEALEYFNHHNELRKQALEAYAQQYGPLTIDSMACDNSWKWASQPMPWEGEVC